MNTESNKREREAFLKSDFFENCEFKINSDGRAILTSDNKFVMNCHDYDFKENLISILKHKKEIHIPQCVSIEVELVTMIETKTIKCTNLQQTCSSFENGRCKMVRANCVFQLFI